MQGANARFYGAMEYSPVWFLFGLALIGLAIGAVIVIFYLTRHKEIKTIANLKIEPPKIVNMNVLRNKYLHLIDEAEESFRRRQIKASECHQKLSKLVRMFYCEAMSFHADIMTLSDIKKSNHKDLAALIEKLYPDEFDTLEKGPVAESAERARQIVRDA